MSNYEEPDIIFDDEDREAPVAPELDLNSISEDDFCSHYKATKEQYSQLIQAIKVLRATHKVLSQPCPMEIDSDLLDNINYLAGDFSDLIEQMHLAAEWEREKH